VERAEFEPLTAEEAGRLLAAAKGDRLEALYVLALTTGLRRGELLGLRWQDVDLDERVLYVRRSLQVGEDGRWRSGDPKTKGSRRPVLLVDLAVDAFKRHRQRQDQERDIAGELWKDPKLVFANTVGGPIWGEDFAEAGLLPAVGACGDPTCPVS
jgi:integrase